MSHLKQFCNLCLSSYVQYVCVLSIVQYVCFYRRFMGVIHSLCIVVRYCQLGHAVYRSGISIQRDTYNLKNIYFTFWVMWNPPIIAYEIIYDLPNFTNAISCSAPVLSSSPKLKIFIVWTIFSTIQETADFDNKPLCIFSTNQHISIGGFWLMLI